MRDASVPVRTVPADASLERARSLTRLLDDAFVIPGTRFRVGLDPILGLIPGLGDLAGGAMSVYLLLVARRAGAPTSVLVRMLGNLVVDSLVGAVPLLGDFFDAGFKANRRNFALLERYVDRPAPTGKASRLVLVAAVIVALLVIIGAVAVTVWLVRLLLSL